MKIEGKIGTMTALKVSAMLLTALIASHRISGANSFTRQVLSQQVPSVTDLWSLRLHTIKSLRSLQADMLFGADPAREAALKAERASDFAEVENDMANFRRHTQGTQLGADETRFQVIVGEVATLKQMEDRAEQLNAQRTPDGTSQAYEMLSADIATLSKNLDAHLLEIVNSEMDHVHAQGEQMQRANRSVLFTLWAATVISGISAATLSLLLAFKISRAIDQVAARADAIAGGDLTGTELRLTTRDQVGSLADAMNHMQASLGSIIGTVVDTAGSLTGSAVSMRSASDQIHRRIDQQSQQTQQAATAMQEMSASIAEVSRHTQSAAETARSAAQTAREGGNIVKEMLGSMHSIAAAVSETSSTVGLLGEDSRRISQIVTVIDEIARKTNLLALNAAIEAARAGEQGRGFAVVAGEVRRLAESTAQATGEIGTMISEIQERTRSAIASMESGTGTVQKGVITTTQAGESLEKIIGMAERVDRMITQIAIAASQQATAADESSASLDSIYNLSHDNLTEMATTAAGIEGLRGTAVTLEKQVDRFHLAQLRTA